MVQIFEKIVEIMGKESDDPACQQFFESLRDPPKTVSQSEDLIYFFENTGLSVYCFDNSIFQVIFHFETALTVPGGMNSFNGTLPFCIQRDDNRSIVKEKIGKNPYRSERVTGEIWDYYSVNQLTVVFAFNVQSGKISSMSVEKSHETE